MQFITDNLSKEKEMDLVFGNLAEINAIFMKDITKKIKKMEKEFINGPMVQFTKDISKMI